MSNVGKIMTQFLRVTVVIKRAAAAKIFPYEHEPPNPVMSTLNIFLGTIQGRAKERSLSCEKVLPVGAWLVLSKI